MKNLIDEIERVIEVLKTERQKCFEEIDYPLSQVDILEGRILAYKDVLNVFKDYNIITAPKIIKLSEIVEKLKNSFDCYTTECKLYREQNKIEVDYYYYSYVECLSSGYVVITNNKIEILVADTSTDIHKWLYTLWIAGTVIVDDMEEKE